MHASLLSDIHVEVYSGRIGLMTVIVPSTRMVVVMVIVV